MSSGKYDKDLQHPHQERIEEARKICGLRYLVIGEYTNFPGCFLETCSMNYRITRGSGGGSSCGILTKHPGNGCPVSSGEKVTLTETEMHYKVYAINALNTEHFSRVRWWDKPDPEENG